MMTMTIMGVILLLLALAAAIGWWAEWRKTGRLLAMLETSEELERGWQAQAARWEQAKVDSDAAMAREVERLHSQLEAASKGGADAALEISLLKAHVEEMAARNAELAELDAAARFAAGDGLRWAGIAPDNVAKLLGSTVPETLWWRWVMQRLEAEIDDAKNRVSDAKLADRAGSLAHAAGALEMLLALRQNLEADRVDAHRVAEREKQKGGRQNG